MRRLGVATAMLVGGIALLAGQAFADDRPASKVVVADNFSGPMELLAITDDGRLLQTKQSADLQSWSEWAPTLAAPVSRVAAVRSAFGGGITAFAIESGQLTIRAQPFADQEFAPGILQKQGSNLNSLAVATDAGNLFVAFAVAQDGTLWGMRQLGQGAWGALTHIGGHDLAGGGGSAALGPVANFVVRPNALAAALGYGGVVSAFAVGSDGVLYFTTEPDRLTLPSVWSSLGGAHLTDVTAFSAAGKATVLALDANNVLMSRSQTLTGSWTPWRNANADPVSAWAALGDGFGGGLLFLASTQGVVYSALAANGGWTAASPYTEFLGNPPGAITPVRQLSAAVAANHTLMLTATDDAGAIFERAFTVQKTGLVYNGGWTRVGRVTVSPNPPDFAGQAVFCVVTNDELADIVSGVNATVTANSGLAPLASPVSARLSCTPNTSTQQIGLWLGREPSPSALPQDLLQSAGKTHDPEVLALRITRSGLDRMLDAVFTSMPKRYPAGGGNDVVLHSAKWSFGSSDLSIDFDGDYGLGKLPIGVTAKVKAVLDVNPDGRLDCTPHISADSKLLEIGSAFLAPVAGNLGFQNYLSKNAGKVGASAGLVCDLVYALPTDVLLPKVTGQPLQKLVFSYNLLKSDKDTGLTVYSTVPPAVQTRNPRVAWFAVNGGVDKKTKDSVAFQFVAGEADMNDPHYSWAATWPGAQITPLDGTRVVQIRFPSPPSVKAGQTLGTVTLSASDDDQQSASQSNTVTITKDMLEGSAPKDPSDVPDPRLPR